LARQIRLRLHSDTPYLGTNAGGKTGGSNPRTARAERGCRKLAPRCSPDEICGFAANYTSGNDLSKFSGHCLSFCIK
jgi:hypothetical protein